MKDVRLISQTKRKSLLGFVIVCERGVTNDLVFVNVFLFLFAKIVHKLVVKSLDGRYVKLS